MSLAAQLSYRLLLTVIVTTYISFKGQPNHIMVASISLYIVGYVMAALHAWTRTSSGNPTA